MKKKIIVIGGGLGGLATGIRLAARGYDVELYEKRDRPGGRAYRYEINGFRFDGGPSLISAPFMLDELFTAAGRRREELVPLLPLPPLQRFIDPQGRVLDMYSDVASMQAEVEMCCPADAAGYARLMADAKVKFDRGFIELADQPFSSIWAMLRAGPDWFALRSRKSLYAHVAQYVADPFLRQVLTYPALQIGGNPFEIRSIYALILHMQRQWGVHFAAGGMGTLVDALAALLVELGGEIHTQTEVREILTQKRKATGIRLADGSARYADAIISNADAAYTYRSLIPETLRRKYSNRRLEKMRHSVSLFVMFFGTRRTYRESGLVHHNVLLPERFEPWAQDVFNRKKLPDDLYLTLYMPTLTDPSLAPEGCETFCVVAPVPNRAAGLDWGQLARSYRDRILFHLEERFLPDLRSSIIAEHYIDPLHFETVLNSYLGAAYGPQPAWNWTGGFRPHNRSEELDNLYLVGAGTHPGAGLPGVLSSAKIVERMIEAQDSPPRGLKR